VRAVNGYLRYGGLVKESFPSRFSAAEHGDSAYVKYLAPRFLAITMSGRAKGHFAQFNQFNIQTACKSSPHGEERRAAQPS
jgi:hypothetical protein